MARPSPALGSILGVESASPPLPFLPTPPSKKGIYIILVSVLKKKKIQKTTKPQVPVLRLTMTLAVNLCLLLMSGPSKQCPCWMVREAVTDTKSGGAQGFWSHFRSHVQSGKLFGKRNPVSRGHGKKTRYKCGSGPLPMVC